MKTLGLFLFLSLLAHAEPVLVVRSFFAARAGWVLVNVQNTGQADQQFDFHQLRGLEVDTLTIIEPGDIRFMPTEIASNTVPAGAVKAFHVLLRSSHALAGLQFVGAKAWRGRDAVSYATAAAADAAARKAFVSERIAHRAGSFNPNAARP